MAKSPTKLYTHSNHKASKEKGLDPNQDLVDKNIVQNDSQSSPQFQAQKRKSVEVVVSPVEIPQSTTKSRQQSDLDDKELAAAQMKNVQKLESILTDNLNVSQREKLMMTPPESSSAGRNRDQLDLPMTADAEHEQN